MTVDANRLDLCNMSAEDTKLLNKLYEEYKFEYANMLDKMSKGKNTIYWWVTPLASKYWFLSDSLKNICIALLGINRIRTNCQIREVYCPSAEVAKVIEGYYKRRKRKICIRVMNNSNSVSVMKQILKYIQYVDTLMQQYRKIRKVVEKHKINIENKNEEIILIDTYIKASEVKGTRYEEQYFKDILKYTDRKLFFMPQLFLNTRISVDMLVKKILSSSTYQYIFKEQFLRIQDIYKVLPYPLFCMGCCISKKYIDKIDVTPIINRDLIRGIVSDNAVEGMLKYWAIKNMKRKGLKVERLIGWYEGQPSSIGLFWGYRKVYPKGKSIGYIGYPADTKNINLANTKMQTFYRAAPQEMAVMAECFKKIPKQFVSNTKVLVIPALRLQKKYQYMNEDRNMKKSIFIALAYRHNVSSRMLMWVKKLEQYFKENAIVLVIKNHPCNTGMTLRQYGVPELKCDYKFSSNQFSDIVNQCCLVVTTQSTSGYETALHGKPIIFLNFSGELNFNYMPKEWCGTRYEIVYSIKELEKTINKYINSDIDNIDTENEKYYVRATRETVARFFQ